MYQNDKKYKDFFQWTRFCFGSRNQSKRVEYTGNTTLSRSWHKKEPIGIEIIVLIGFFTFVEVEGTKSYRLEVEPSKRLV